jgi:16S rRNA processing protein RimM
VCDELSDGFITLARVVKTQGLHGEVAAEVHTAAPDRFAPGMKLFALCESQERHRELEIEDIWPHKNWLVLKFAGIDSISAAEPLVGAELQVPRAQRAALEPGWTYVSDLVGCSLFDSGREIGRIADVQFGAGEAPLIVVADSGGKHYEVPFAEVYLETVDMQRREVRMKLPEGMLEINAPMTDDEKQQQARPAKRRKR